jgi:hypothetical protein
MPVVGRTPGLQTRKKIISSAVKNIRICCRRFDGRLFPFRPSRVNNPPQSIAVIDGSLCQLSREGIHTAAHSPLATAVVEFCRGAHCYYVREHPHGLLPGIPNLYCLDRELRLQWLAEWPLTDDPGSCD